MTSKARQSKADAKRRKAKARARAAAEYRTWVDRPRKEPLTTPPKSGPAMATMLGMMGDSHIRPTEEQMVRFFGTPEEKLCFIREKLEARKHG